MRHVLLVCLGLLLACSGEPNIEPIPPVQGTSLAGLVTGVDGQPIAGATVTVDGRTLTTGADGRFDAGAVPAGPELLVAVRADGHSSNVQPVQPVTGAAHQVHLRLTEAHRLVLADASAGGRLVSPDGVAVELPAASLRLPDGSLAAGPVDVTVALLNTPHAALAAPGGLRAAEAIDGSTFPLESFGMAEVTLSQQGQPLTFEGFSRLELPLSPTSEHVDGDVIPMWAFDEEAGVWLPEGEAVVQGDRAIAQVTHYTWWNADIPMETSGIRGRLVDPDGQPVGFVTVYSEGLDYMGSTATAPDEDGRFCVAVRRDSKARLLVKVDSENEWWVDVDTLAEQGRCDNPTGPGILDIGQQVIVAGYEGDLDGDGWTVGGGDCDDLDPETHPGATETCDGRDADCNGVIGDATDDADGDGYRACVDCDDDDPSVHPFAPELCGGPIDYDCDGEIGPWNTDADGDGQTPCAGDCDDADPAVTDACAFEALDAGGFFTCGLQADGLVRCWGWEAGLVWTPPPMQFEAIRAGHFMGCGLTVEQGVECWTADGLLSPSPVEGLFLDVGVGEDHGCGVLTDGSLSCWGTDDAGETSPPDGAFTAVTSGRDFSCAVASDGLPLCWGDDAYGLTTPRQVEAVAVTAGAFHACLLTADGRAECWGRDANGEATAPPLTFVQLDAGWEHTCGLLTDGRIRCWGSDSYGESGSPPGSFEHVTAGRNHTCGVRAGGQVECWGLDAQGQASDPFGG